MLTHSASTPPAADVEEIASIPLQMIEAWNRGDPDGLAGLFTDTAELVASDGTLLGGRAEIAAFHRSLFETAPNGARLIGYVQHVRRLDRERAVMRAFTSTVLPDEQVASPSRDLATSDRGAADVARPVRGPARRCPTAGGRAHRRARDPRRPDVPLGVASPTAPRCA
jgi:uncharacterized protein (TIGR02246 family)